MASTLTKGVLIRTKYNPPFQNQTEGFLANMYCLKNDTPIHMNNAHSITFSARHDKRSADKISKYYRSSTSTKGKFDKRPLVD
jgi:hypothetical protein